MSDNSPSVVCLRHADQKVFRGMLAPLMGEGWQVLSSGMGVVPDLNVVWWAILTRSRPAAGRAQPGGPERVLEPLESLAEASPVPPRPGAAPPGGGLVEEARGQQYAKALAGGEEALAEKIRQLLKSKWPELLNFELDPTDLAFYIARGLRR